MADTEWPPTRQVQEVVLPERYKTLPQPRRLHSDGRYLLVTTTFEHAVQVLAIAALSSASRPTRLGGVGRLNLPESAVLSGDRLFVADTANNRVLVWHNINEALAGRWPPDAVLGQPDLDTRVAAIGRDRLFFPGAVYYDGTYLWVGEFKFLGSPAALQPRAVAPQAALRAPEFAA